MHLSSEDIAGIVGLVFLLAMGAWAAINPAGWIRYIPRRKRNLSPEEPMGRGCGILQGYSRDREELEVEVSFVSILDQQSEFLPACDHRATARR
jgi:hypothetical protein